MEVLHARDRSVCKRGLARGQESSLFFLEFKLIREFHKICEICEAAVAARGLLHTRSSGGEKNCIVYSLLCISIILISLLLLLLVVPLLSY